MLDALADVEMHAIQTSGNCIRNVTADHFAGAAADEIEDPQNLNLWCELNGEMQQNSSTSDMIFSVQEIIAYMSRFMTLRVGDIIATGTPEGVGMGQNPKRFIRAGDEMRLGVEGLGIQHQRFI